MKASFFCIVVFPVIPWVLGMLAAIGCNLAGVGVNGWWELVAALTIMAAIPFAWYGNKKGYELL